MYTFRTESGAIYAIENGRITRASEHGILGHEDREITNLPFTMSAPPTEGHRFFFQPKGWERGVSTSRVVVIHREVPPGRAFQAPEMWPVAYADHEDGDLLAIEANLR